MLIDKSQVKRTLVITLSNVGDIILTTPVIKVLSREFPASRIDVMVGPDGKEIFEKDPRIFKLIIYDKHMPIAQKRRLQLKLKKMRYDLVVDLKNTIFPLLLGPRYRTGTIQTFPKELNHRSERHLYRLKSLGIGGPSEPSYMHIPKEDEEYVSNLLKEHKVHDPIVVVSPGAKSHLKKWTIDGFANACDKLIAECRTDVIFIGLKEDVETIKMIADKMKAGAHNFVKMTNIRQLAGLLKSSRLLITNDSAPLHLGCACGTKVLALFGPTAPAKYGPTGEFDVVINKRLSCAPCESATCKYNYECMKLISPEEVFDAARMMLGGYG